MRRGLMITAAAAALMMCAAPAANASSGWAIQPTPNVSGATGSELNGVSCTSATNCIAVGDSYVAGQPSTTLAEQWNGSTWAIQTTANPTGAKGATLNAVSCSSATNCNAVGQDASDTTDAIQTLAEHWDGSTWTVEPTPTKSGQTELLGVSCPSALSCVAVGSQYYGADPTEAVVERWNGSVWRMQDIPSPAGATRTGLNGVSCTSGTDCTVAGLYKPPAPAGERMLAEQWNGTDWTIQTTPSPTGSKSSILYGVSCHTATSCVATGGYTVNGSFGTLAFGEQWNGTAWTSQSIASPAGAKDFYLSGVSCALASHCVAAGYWVGPEGGDRLAAATWAGSTWKVQNVPVPPTSVTIRYLQGVWCPSAAGCTAVGYASPDTSGSADFTLAEVS
jgi:hypothetical protein